jgi:hypothetical protein
VLQSLVFELGQPAAPRREPVFYPSFMVERQRESMATTAGLWAT